MSEEKKLENWNNIPYKKQKLLLNYYKIEKIYDKNNTAHVDAWCKVLEAGLDICLIPDSVIAKNDARLSSDGFCNPNAWLVKG